LAWRNHFELARELIMTQQRANAIFNKPSGWTWALTGILIGGVVALLVHWPAQWLAQTLAQMTHGQVQLQEAQGSVWQGSGKLIMTGGEGSRDAMALPGRISWQLSLKPQGFALPRLHFQLLAACCMAQAAQFQLSAQLSQRPWQWHLQMDDHRSQWPAHLLSGLGAPWNTLQPEGNLTVTTQQMQIQGMAGQAALQGNLQLTAENMSSKLSTLRPMGTYQVNLGTTTATRAVSEATLGATPVLTLTTLSGSLLLNGQGQWQGNHFQFRGEASAVPEHAAALSNLLNIIGRRQGARSLLSLG
jgi:general secretion pathway protein N